KFQGVPPAELPALIGYSLAAGLAVGAVRPRLGTARGRIVTTFAVVAIGYFWLTMWDDRSLSSTLKAAPLLLLVAALMTIVIFARELASAWLRRRSRQARRETQS
ncbi:MAG TPA: hypothetical protein VFT43_07075, partial [Candidatus Polarisedimenticolia bacterium]|nr:hypothetical protein [Candidatus Polarisedimenticolia bacterium]